MRFQHRIVRGAFTLVELLVVIGIIGLLIALILPVVHRSRAHARQVECAARLRQLIAAAHLYQADHKVAPPPPFIPAVSQVVPVAHTQPFLEMTLAYLGDKHTVIDPAQNTAQLPQVLRCPSYILTGQFADVVTAWGIPFWYTGYMYSARLDEPPNLGTVLKPERTADARMRHRRVIWSDSLAVFDISGTYSYAYFHQSGGKPTDPVWGMFPDYDTMRGYNRGWSDGSVEWVPKDLTGLAPGSPSAYASYKAFAPGLFDAYYVY